MKLKRLSLFLALVMIISAFAGTFTFASAANSKGGTFEVWRGGEKVAEVTTQTTIDAAIGAGTIKSGDTVKLTGNYTSDGYEQDNMLITLTIDGQGYSMTNGSSGRFFNLGSNANTAANITVTFKNLTMTAKNTSGFVQMNRPGENVVFDNVTLKLQTGTGTSGTGAIVMIHPNQNVTIKNSTAEISTNFINIRATNQTVTISDTFINASAGAASHAMIRCEPAATGYKLDMDRVAINESGGKNFTRVIASYPKNAEITIDDCSIFSRGTDSIFELTGEGTNLTVNNSQLAQYVNGDVLEIQEYSQGNDSYKGISTGKNLTASFNNCVILSNAADYENNGTWYRYAAISVESGSNANVSLTNSIVKAQNTTAIKVIADTAISMNNCRVFCGAYSPVVATASKVTMTNTALSTDASVPMLDDNAGTADIAGANGYYTTSDIAAATAATADEYAANVLQKPVRIADAATAYANGTFAGYYSSITAAKAALNGATEVFIVGDYNTFGRETATGISTITGVVKADGSKPVVATTQRFTGNVTTAMTYANFELVNTFSDCCAQINAGGVLTLNNMVVAADNANGCLVLQKGSKVVINNSTIDAMTSSGVRFNETADGQVPTAEINNSILKASEGGKAVYLLVNGIMNISEDSKVIVDDADGFEIGSKTLTVNGTEITSNVAAAAMLTGASVRIAKGATAENLVESGIRFESKLTAAQIAAAEASGATITYGTVVFKYNDLGNKTVAELVEAANADANDNLKVADIKAVNGKVIDEETGDMTIRAAIINIKEANYNAAFGAVAYIELTYENGSTVRIYGAFDSTNNVRSIKQVAESALADYKTAEEIEANEGYTFGNWNYTNEITVEIEGVETTVYSCYTDEQIAILNTYAGK